MQKAEPKAVTEAMLTEAENAQALLQADNVDIDHLIEQRLVIMEKRHQASMATNSLLEDKDIEMHGYMVALQSGNDKVTEFLLVPNVGTCSHKALPAANQILLVKATQAVDVKPTYLPIKVNGTLRITHISQKSFIGDGEKQVDISYTLEDAEIQ
ncbi:MAG: DUF3299 domain-containing protein [Psychromonas sp.]